MIDVFIGAGVALLAIAALFCPPIWVGFSSGEFWKMIRQASYMYFEPLIWAWRLLFKRKDGA